MTTYPKTERNEVRQAAARAHYDHETVHGIIDSVRLCHVAFIADGHPVSIPMTHARDGQRILLHGSPDSRLFQHLRGGEVALSFAVEDGVVFARSAFHHAQNYRSAVVFGHGSWIEDPAEAREAFRIFLERLFPGRWGEVRPPTQAELASSVIAAVEIESASAKLRAAGVGEAPADRAKEEWHGVVPLQLRAGEPQGEGGELPAAVRAFIARTNGG